jgi:hypothetical protein
MVISYVRVSSGSVGTRVLNFRAILRFRQVVGAALSLDSVRLVEFSTSFGSRS